MRALGADVKRTVKAEGMIGAQQVARQYAKDTQSIYMNQFETAHNPDAYTNTLGKELTGSSSGAALQGALELKNQINKGIIVTIFPDGSDRYMSKQIFNYKENENNE